MLISHRINPLPVWSMPLLMLLNADSLYWDLWPSLTTDCPGWQSSSSQAKPAPAVPMTGQTSAMLGMCLNQWPFCSLRPGYASSEFGCEKEAAKPSQGMSGEFFRMNYQREGVLAANKVIWDRGQLLIEKSENEHFCSFLFLMAVETAHWKKGIFQNNCFYELGSRWSAGRDIFCSAS